MVMVENVPFWVFFIDYEEWNDRSKAFVKPNRIPPFW